MGNIVAEYALALVRLGHQGELLCRVVTDQDGATHTHRENKTR